MSPSTSPPFFTPKNKRRLKLLLVVKLLIVILYFVLRSVYSDGDHEKEIEKMEQMLRENTNEENEWKEDLKEVM